MPKLHLVRLMRERIAQLGNKAALRVQQDGQWRAIGWRTLGQAMDYCAQALIRAGHQPTEMVGIYARNMPEWTQADLGILAARGVSVPIYPTSTLNQAALHRQRCRHQGAVRWRTTPVRSGAATD